MTQRMNMIRKKSFLGMISLSVLMIGCQSDDLGNISAGQGKKIELSTEELLVLQCSDSPELNEEEVIALVKLFRSNGQKDVATSRSSVQPVTFQIKGKYYMDEEGTTSGKPETKMAEGEYIPIYEVGIASGTDNGIAIVSGDRRVPYVLAYIDRIGENDTIAAAPNALIQWGEMYLKNGVLAFDAVKDSLYASAVSKIAKELNIDALDVEYEKIKHVISSDIPTSRSQPVDEVPSNLRIQQAIFPMCPVTWGQWEPYNCQLPEGECEKYFPGYSEYLHYPTGAGALTVAHLMACIEPALTAYGTAMDWAYLTETAEIKAPDYFNAGDPLKKREMVGKLFKLAYTQVKSSVATNSKGVVTGVFCKISDMTDYIRSFFRCDKIRDWNINSIKTSLKAYHPVLVYGKPDNKTPSDVYPFIIDGLKECYGRIDNVPYDINVSYLHANFGFGNGYQDGYYLMDVEKNTITFETTIPLIFKDKALKMIGNIQKK